jgi:hypothetical protein
MRKIEQDMIAAILGNFDWDKSNTYIFSEDIIAMRTGTVQLHGNIIARYKTHPLTEKRTITFNFCGWQTVTTKSRINAILEYFNLGCVFQKNYRLYYVNSSGKELQISNNEWIVAE